MDTAGRELSPSASPTPPSASGYSAALTHLSPQSSLGNVILLHGAAQKGGDPDDKTLEKKTHVIRRALTLLLAAKAASGGERPNEGDLGA